MFNSAHINYIIEKYNCKAESQTVSLDDIYTYRNYYKIIIEDVYILFVEEASTVIDILCYLQSKCLQYKVINY